MRAKRGGAAAGFLWALPFLFTGFAGIAWLLPATLLFVAGGGGRRFQTGYWSGLCFHLAALYWLLFMPVFLGAVCAWLALSAYCALYPAVWVFFCWRMLPPPKPSAPAKFPELWKRLDALTWSERQLWALAGAMGWASIEVLQAHLFTGFPWNFLAVSQVEMLPLIQLASWTGVYGVSFLIAWVSLSLGLAVAEIAARPGSPWVWGREILPAGLALAVVWIWGFQRIQNAPQTADRLRIALIQPSVEQRLIWRGEGKEERFAELLTLSEAAMSTQPRPDLLVWPESGLPAELERPERVAEFIRKNRVPLIFNAIDSSQPSPSAEPRYHNAAFLMNSNGLIVDKAHKRRLVLFGEYVPLANKFPFLKALSPISAGYTPGEEPGVLELDDPPIAAGALICFEDAFPSLAREAARRNPDFLINLTNAAWFGESQAQWQQARSAVFRAVETRLPLVRCANNGITCWIDAYGRMRARSMKSPADAYKKGFQVAEVSLSHPSSTPYLRQGDLFGWCCVSVCFALILIREWPRLRKQAALRKSTAAKANHVPLP